MLTNTKIFEVFKYNKTLNNNNYVRVLSITIKVDKTFFEKQILNTASKYYKIVEIVICYDN